MFKSGGYNIYPREIEAVAPSGAAIGHPISPMERIDARAAFQ